LRGRSSLITCVFCGRRVPVDKASRFTRYGFSYYDERAGLKYRGIPQTNYCCPSCARRKGVKSERPMKGRPKRR